MEKQFEQFLESEWGLELWLGNEIIFRSKKSGVKGLLDFINERQEPCRDLVIFDKIVGQGAAFLAAYLNTREVYGGVGSELAAKALEKYKIKFYFLKTIPNILNRDKTDLCPLEKLSLDKTPEEFYNALKQKCLS